MGTGSGLAGVGTELRNLAEATFSGGESRTDLWGWRRWGDWAWCSEPRAWLLGSGQTMRSGALGMGVRLVLPTAESSAPGSGWHRVGANENLWNE